MRKKRAHPAKLPETLQTWNRSTGEIQDCKLVSDLKEELTLETGIEVAMDESTCGKTFYSPSTYLTLG
ncbi:hypothetical protein [Thermococcus sp.]